jgi:hypothetical protein
LAPTSNPASNARTRCGPICSGVFNFAARRVAAASHVSSSVPCVRPVEGIGGAHDTRARRRLTDQQPHTAAVAGLQAAALQRPPSWSGAAALPSVGAWCSCCRGQRWWSEARDPTGWRCSACHPPTHLPADAVREVQT